MQICGESTSLLAIVPSILADTEFAMKHLSLSVSRSKSTQSLRQQPQQTVLHSLASFLVADGRELGMQAAWAIQW